MYKEIIEIPNTTQQIIRIFKEAETNTRKLISKTVGYCNEPEITFINRIELNKTIKSSKIICDVRDAFTKDLVKKLGGYKLGWEIKDKIGNLAENLIIKIDWHYIQKEKKTGGDLGLVFDHPMMKIERNNNCTELEIDNKSKKTGLLVQAKLKKFNSKWGKFTKKQKRNLPKRNGYLCILLYEYQNIENNKLKKFTWLDFDKYKFRDIKKLNDVDIDKFNPRPTSLIIQALIESKIGTTKRDTIKRYIYTKVSQYLEMKLIWKRPQSTKYIISDINRKMASKKKVGQKVSVRRDV